MHACGLGKGVLIKAAMILMLFTSLVAAVNVIWLGPWSSRYQDEVTQNAKANPERRRCAAAVPDLQRRQYRAVRRRRERQQVRQRVRAAAAEGNARPSVVLADSGHMEQHKDGSQTVTLDKGTRFEGTALLRDFRITDFVNYQALVGYKEAVLDPNDADQADISTLIKTKTPQFRGAALASDAGVRCAGDGADGSAAQRG